MRILVVDDEFVTLSKLKKILMFYGECDVAANGKNALEMFSKAYNDSNPYDLVTMDIDMPDLRGQDVVQAIRDFELNHEIEKETKILMVSGMYDQRNIDSSFEVGCEHFLKKPFSKEELLKTLEILLGPLS